jgi:hypothetical protein
MEPLSTLWLMGAATTLFAVSILVLGSFVSPRWDAWSKLTCRLLAVFSYAYVGLYLYLARHSSLSSASYEKLYIIKILCLGMASGMLVRLFGRYAVRHLLKRKDEPRGEDINDR